MAGTDSRSLKATWLATRLAGRISARLGGAFASRLWFTPWEVPVTPKGRAKQAGWLEATEPTSFYVDSREIHGFCAGEGPTVLLVHGWGEHGASLGGFIAPLVDAGYRVVGIDLPGHGATSRGRTNIFELAGAVWGVANELGGIQSVIAHSMGGYVTTVALSQGLLAESVVMIAPATSVQNALVKFGSMFMLPPRSIRGLRADIQRRFGDDVWTRLDGPALARNFKVPALIVHDSDDPQVDLSESEELAAAWPGARLVTTSGLGHTHILRAPEVLGWTTRFLAGSADPFTPELVPTTPEVIDLVPERSGSTAA